MSKRYSAKIVKHPTVAAWQAVFWAFDAEAKTWRRRMRSTQTTSKGRAQAIADEYQELAHKAAGTTDDSRISREYVLGVLNTILRMAGSRPVEETRGWDEYSQEWLGLQKGRIADRSLESYESHIRQFTRWLGASKNCKLNTITGLEMQTWYLDMIEEGRKPATVNNTVKAIQSVFDRARAEGFCQRNPAELIMRQYGDKDIREPFTPEDITKILAYLRRTKDKDEWLTVTLLGLCTGQRLQDCAQASSAHLDKPKSGPWIWRCTQGKTGAKVEVPIVEPLASHLRALEARPGRTSLFLCPSLAGLPSGSPEGLSMQFSAILDAAGIERERREKTEGSKGQTWTNKTFHSLRHTCNSLMANAGVSDDVRIKILGHSTVKMNQRYTHMDAATSEAALIKAISAALG